MKSKAKPINQLLISLILICGYVSSYAQINRPDSLGIELKEIFVESGFFAHKQQEFAGSFSPITPKQLNKGDALNLQTILNGSPGVFMQSGALNTNRITIRGIGARSPFATNKIKAYVDDIPISNGDGESAIEDFNLGALSGLEIYRGPVSTQFGAGLGGAIHLNANQLKPKNEVSADALFGSFGLRKYNVLADFGTTKKSFKIFYQNVLSDGYRDNNEYERQSVTALFKIRAGKKSYVSTLLNSVHMKAFIPSSLNEEDYLNNPSAAGGSWGSARGNEDNQRFNIGFSINTEHNSKFESSISTYVNGGNSNEVTPIRSIGNEEIMFTNLGMRAKLNGSFLDNRLRTVFGFEFMLEGYELERFVNDAGTNGELFSSFDQQRNYGNFFMASEFSPDTNWIFELGLNVNSTTFQNNDRLLVDGNDQSGQHSFAPVYSPKISVSRQIGNELRAYGLIAHGFSSATFEETVNPGGEINNDLKAENGFNYEIGIKGHLLNQKIYFELAGYSMQINDLIINRTDDFGAPFFYNAGKTDHNGLELLVTQKVIESDLIAVNQQFSYSLMTYRFDEFVAESGDYSGNKLTGVPSYSLDYLVSLNSKIGAYMNINWQSVGQQPLSDDNVGFAEGYNLINLKIGYENQIGQLGLKIYFGTNNLLDEKYASMIQINAGSFGGNAPRYYYPGLPRNHFGGVNLSFAF